MFATRTSLVVKYFDETLVICFEALCWSFFARIYVDCVKFKFRRLSIPRRHHLSLH